VLIASLLVTTVLALAYRLLWRRRYGRPPASAYLERVQGRVLGPGARGAPVCRMEGAALIARPFEVDLERRPAPQRAVAGSCRDQHVADRRQLVDPTGAACELRGGPLCVGDRVTIDAAASTCLAPESLYRASALRPALAAVRLARGAWPRLRWLDLVAAAGALASLWVVTHPRLPAGLAPLVCPAGTRSAGGAPPRDFFEWCERDRGETLGAGGQEAVKHGPFRVFWESGALRQLGGYLEGRAEGEWRSWHHDGRLAERGAFSAGLREGLWERWTPDGRPRAQERYRAGKLISSVAAGDVAAGLDELSRHP